MAQVMQFWKFATLLSVAMFLCLVFTGSLSARKPKPEVTQVLALPKDPPAVAIGDSTRLVFQVSPLSAKGLLSQQTRDALRAILKSNGGAQVIHIRAFVAGSGDLRRVPQIVSEIFGEKKLPLPSVSVIQAGGLPLENAQIVIEAVSEAKKETNPAGLTFIAGQESLERLGTPVAVSCFVSDIAAAAHLASEMSSRFPAAAFNVVQTQRIPVRPMTSCEAVVRGGASGQTGTTGRLAFTGTRVAFGSAEKDARLAFQRLDRDLTEARVATADVISTNIYALSTPLGEMARKFRETSGVLTIVPFEGVASMEASFAVDAVATVAK
jgi:enamine deaminase RidA (YjgF/YER057c/UK114 family)